MRRNRLWVEAREAQGTQGLLWLGVPRHNPQIPAYATYYGIMSVSSSWHSKAASALFVSRESLHRGSNHMPVFRFGRLSRVFHE